MSTPRQKSRACCAKLTKVAAEPERKSRSFASKSRRKGNKIAIAELYKHADKKSRRLELKNDFPVKVGANATQVVAELKKTRPTKERHRRARKSRRKGTKSRRRVRKIRTSEPTKV